MTKRTGGDSINQGPAPQPDRRDRKAEAVAGNVRTKGEDPSPDDRERGEASGADAAAPLDLDTVHDRAS